MLNDLDRLSVEEVVARVEAWLKLPGSIEALQAAFEEADRFNQKLAERAKHIPFSPLTNNPKPRRLRREIFYPFETRTLAGLMTVSSISQPASTSAMM